MPPVPSGPKHRAQCFKTPNLAAGYIYKHTPLSGTQFVNHDMYAEDSEHDDYFIPDLRSD
jgi:hypothetical protein